LRQAGGSLKSGSKRSPPKRGPFSILSQHNDLKFKYIFKYVKKAFGNFLTCSLRLYLTEINCRSYRMHKHNSLERCWLTEREVSGITGLSVSTLQKQRLYSRGIPYSKIGKSVRYAYDDVMAFMWAARIDPAGNQTPSAPACCRR